MFANQGWWIVETEGEFLVILVFQAQAQVGNAGVGRNIECASLHVHVIQSGVFCVDGCKRVRKAG